MNINKGTLAKEVSGVLQYVYPRTSADMVKYDDNQDVKQKIQSIDTALSNIIRFSNMQEMLDNSSDLHDGSLVFTKGYYSENDGGAAKYHISGVGSDSVDGVNVIQISDTLVAKPIDTNSNVLCYGIVKDSIVDVDKLNAFFVVNTRAFFPPGLYTVSKPITIPNYRTLEGVFSSYPNINLNEAGKDSFLPKSNTILNFDYNIIDEDSAAITTGTNCTVKNIIIKSNAYEQIEDRSLLLDGANQPIFTVTIAKSIHGIKLNEYSSLCENVFCYGFGGTGYYLGTYSRVIHCHVAKCKTGFGTYGQDITMDDLKIVGCTYGIFTQNPSYLLRCSHVRGDSLAQFGLILMGQSGYFIDINMDGCYKCGIKIVGNGNIVKDFNTRSGFKCARITDPTQISSDDADGFSKVFINGNRNHVELPMSIPNLSDTSTLVYGNASNVALESGSTGNEIVFTTIPIDYPILKNLTRYVYCVSGNAPGTNIKTPGDSLYHPSYDNDILATYVNGIIYGKRYAQPASAHNGFKYYDENGDLWIYYNGSWHKIASDDKVSLISETLEEAISNIEINSARIDTFTSLPEGSTVEDAIWEDIQVGYDGTVYDGAGNAVRAQISDLHNITNDQKAFLVNAFQNSEIFKNKIDIIYGKYMSVHSGTIIKYETAAYCTVDVNEGEIYLVSAVSDVNTGIVFLDELGNYISGMGSLGTMINRPVVIPSGVKTMAVSCSRYDGAIFSVSNPINMVSYENWKSLLSTLSNGLQYINIPLNLYDGIYINTSGVFTTNDSASFTLLKADSGDMYLVSASTSTNIGIVFLDSRFEVISYLTGIGNIENYEVRVPENTTYMAVSTSNKDDYPIEVKYYIPEFVSAKDLDKKANAGYSFTPIDGLITNNKLYNFKTGETYEGSSDYSYLTITEGFECGDTVFISGATATSISLYYTAAFFDNNDNILKRIGNKSSGIYENIETIIPDGTVKIIVNSNKSATISPAVKYGEIITTPISDVINRIDELETSISELYQLNIAEAMVREAKKNPFKLSAFDKGYVTFVFDDLRHDIDLVSSIFAEYGLPFGIAAIPKYLNNIADGLTSESNGFTVGMSMTEIMDQVVSNGGEILAHNVRVVSETTQYDYDFMYEYYVNCRKTLEEKGYTIRGLLRAGGTTAINGSAEIEKWLIGNYEYSNMGTAENYSQNRESLNKSVSSIKALIDDAVTNKTWVKFMAHTLDGSEALITEASLREILQYCVDNNISVVTYAYIFDNFSSSTLLESLK